MAQPLDPEKIILEAQRLIDRVQNDLEQSSDFFHEQGLDPAKVRQTLQAQMTPQAEQQLQSAFQEDLAAIEQEVMEEFARLGHTVQEQAPSTRPNRMRRSMI